MRQWLRKLMTLNGSPRGIAGGFALGLSLSLVPLPFAGMFVALAMAPLLRCNLPATYLGSAVVNPLTGPFIYFAELWLGLWVMGRELPSWARMQELDAVGWWEVFEHAVVPFMLGASLCCAAGLVISFPLIWSMVGRWQLRHPHHERAASEG
jgi:uncharacterized protein (DUF2062 family)